MPTSLANILRHAAITAISIAVAIFAWAVFAANFAYPDLVPSPSDTLKTATQMIKSGDLFTHVGVSLERVLVGYLAGCVLGVLTAH